MGLSAPTLVDAPAAKSGPIVNALTARPSDEFLSLITHEFARRHLVLSAGTDGGCEGLLIADSTFWECNDSVIFFFIDSFNKWLWLSV